MNLAKLKLPLVVLAATMTLAGCSTSSAAQTSQAETKSSHSVAATAGTPTHTPTPTVASKLPAGIRTDGFYLQNSRSGYDCLFQFNSDGTVSGLYTVVSPSDLAKYKPGSGNLRKYWLNVPQSNGSPYTPQKFGPNVLGQTEEPIAADGTFGYRDSSGPITFKFIRVVSTNVILMSLTSSDGVFTDYWNFTKY